MQPSSVEGLPIALLEALAAGRFPIVSDIPENLEAVAVAGNPEGLHVPVGDAEALGAAIQDAIGRTDREAGRRTARRARAAGSSTGTASPRPPSASTRR